MAKHACALDERDFWKAGHESSNLERPTTACNSKKRIAKMRTLGPFITRT